MAKTNRLSRRLLKALQHAARLLPLLLVAESEAGQQLRPRLPPQLKTTQKLLQLQCHLELIGLPSEAGAESTVAMGGRQRTTCRCRGAAIHQRRWTDDRGHRSMSPPLDVDGSKR